MGMKKNKNQKKSNVDNGKSVITDERFKKVHTDPRFQKVPKHKAKVAIDSRFSAMFTDKRFATSSAPLDKRGKLKKGSSEVALRRYYRMEEDEDRGEEKKKRKNIAAMEEGGGESDDTDTAELLESGDELDLSKSKSMVDEDDEEESEDDFVDGDTSEEEVDMQGDATSSTTDTDEERDADLEDDDDSVEVENVPTIEKETHRLAIVNMDWGQVKADDLFVVLSSFLPKGGQILSVSVYPSEFGLKRMEEEALRGPAALFDGEEENKDKDSDDETDDDDEIDTEKLRAYERSKLRYYYAVVVCDSVATADYLYKSCDGAEFERSSNVLDVRFIPDDMEFKHPPRDQATEAPADYEGLDFHTRALQHSNVNLSWDEDEPHRVKTLNRKFNTDQLADLELKEFLASDESESESEDETEDPAERKKRKMEKYRALIQSGNGSEEEEEEGQDMEITFNTGLENISKKILEKKDAKLESVWEKHLRNKKEKKKARKNRSSDSSDDESDYSIDDASEEPDDFFEEEPPLKKTKKVGSGKKKRNEINSMNTETEGAASVAELELLLADDKPEDKIKGYKIKAGKTKQKKGKKEAMVEDKLPDVDLTDPRFAAFLKRPSYALDPTDPQYKRSAAFARRLMQHEHKGREEVFEEDVSNMNKSGPESLNKQGNDEDGQSNSDKITSKDKLELSMLVKSVKMKSKQVPLQSDNRKMSNSSRKKRKHDQ